MSVNIGLNDQQLQSSISILNQLLADEFTLYTKTRNYHWNLVSRSFSELHKFFEEQYEQLADIKDEVAERVRFLGGFATGTLTEFAQQKRLSEQPGEQPKAEQMLKNLVNDHEAIIRHLREDAEVAEENNDMGTNDFLIGIMEKHEKMAWMLRSYLEN